MVKNSSSFIANTAIWKETLFAACAFGRITHKWKIAKTLRNIVVAVCFGK